MPSQKGDRIVTNRSTILIASMVLAFGSTMAGQAAGGDDTPVVSVTEPSATPLETADQTAAPEPDPVATAECPRRECCQKRLAAASEKRTSEDGFRCRCGRHASVVESAGAGAGCGRRHGHGRSPGDRQGLGGGSASGRRQESGSGGGAGPGGGPRGGKRAEMEVYRTLLENHDQIERTIENVPGGVRTTTTTTDPDLVPELRRHVSQMKALVEGGGHIRIWDPLFAEIFRHADQIEMTIEDVDGGVAVTETSAEEDVVALIRAHALKVDQFIARGYEAYAEETPLPEDYPTKR
jgi:hypothetical protein